MTLAEAVGVGSGEWHLPQNRVAIAPIRIEKTSARQPKLPESYHPELILYLDMRHMSAVDA
jgi:hypothetical protein